MTFACCICRFTDSLHPSEEKVIVAGTVRHVNVRLFNLPILTTHMKTYLNVDVGDKSLVLEKM